MNEVYGIAYSCPYNERLNDSPFYQSDSLSFDEKFSLIEGFQPERIKEIISHHRQCSCWQDKRFL